MMNSLSLPRLRSSLSLARDSARDTTEGPVDLRLDVVNGYVGPDYLVVLPTDQRVVRDQMVRKFFVVLGAEVDHLVRY